MKIIKYLIVVLVLSLGTSCSKDFLENTPPTSLDPSKFDESKVEDLRNLIYTYIPGSGLVFEDGWVDNAYSRNAWDSNGLLIQTNTITANQNQGYSYSGVRRCNLVIHYINQFNIDEAKKIQYIAEARVMRAWQYTTLTLRFGDVPLVTEYNQEMPEGLERAPKEEVRKWIINEFKESIADLPVKNKTARFNKYMAESLLARAAYYFGDYEQAKQSATTVIDEGGYKLYTVGELSKDQLRDAEIYKQFITDPNIDKDKFIKGIFSYNNLWNVDNNTETIIAKEYLGETKDYTDYNRFTSLLAPYLTTQVGYNIIAPLQDLVNSYWTSEGEVPNLPSKAERERNYNELRSEVDAIGGSYQDAVKSISETLGSKPYLDEFKNRDSRLYASIIFPFSPVNYYVEEGFGRYEFEINEYGQSGYVWRKKSGGKGIPYNNGGMKFYSGYDYPVVRLGEMYLILAESTVQVEGYNATAQDAINQLRDRCGMPHVKTGLDKNQALDMIRTERRIELAGEGLRYFDIRLYENDDLNGGYKGVQAASNVMKGISYDVEAHKCVDKQWSPRLMYMPIPISAMDKNPKLTQNPGY